MKKQGLLNPHILKIIASMGHHDRLVICDSGLPIPNGHDVVDISLSPGVPKFTDVLRVVLEELAVESAVVATELQSGNNGFYGEIKEMLDGVKIESVTHEDFKVLTRKNENNTAFIRTGETTSFANIMLIGGVTF